MEVSGELHDPDALIPGKEIPWPLKRKLGGPHSQSVLFGERILGAGSFSP